MLFKGLVAEVLSWIPCHRRPERSFFYKGQPLPLCARCTGLYPSALLGFLFFLVHPIRNKRTMGVLLIAPMYIDGITQYNKLRTSNNFLRFFTGVMAGLGFSMVIAIEMRNITHLIIKTLWHKTNVV
jgi:uncharacterized membrane protein